MVKRGNARKLPPIRDWPTFWFARLEEAVRDQDAEKQAKSIRELKRLGYSVRVLSEEAQEIGT